MKSTSVSKFHFRIRTRSGVIVDNLAIFGQNEAVALQKLRQMYTDCEILDCQAQAASPVGRHSCVNYEDVVDLIIAA